MKGIGDLMKQAQEMQASMQENMQKAQAELHNLEVTGESGAGLVSINFNGRYEARSVKIDPSLLGEDKDVLEDLIAAAINDGARRVEVAAKEKMAAVTDGMGLPPGFKLPL